MIVVDTNVTSELMRSVPSPVVVGWLRSCDSAELFTTSITLAEIGYGVERLPEGRRKDLLRAAANDVFSAFPEQALSFDVDSAFFYGHIVSARDRVGSPIQVFDAQIASICRARNAALATRNLRDFHDTGITLVDPWDYRP